MPARSQCAARLSHRASPRVDPGDGAPCSRARDSAPASSARGSPTCATLPLAVEPDAVWALAPYARVARIYPRTSLVVAVIRGVQARVRRTPVPRRLAARRATARSRALIASATSSRAPAHPRVSPSRSLGRYGAGAVVGRARPATSRCGASTPDPRLAHAHRRGRPRLHHVADRVAQARPMPSSSAASSPARACALALRPRSARLHRPAARRLAPRRSCTPRRGLPRSAPTSPSTA